MTNINNIKDIKDNLTYGEVFVNIGRNNQESTTRYFSFLFLPP